jgi:hypothetical protein
MATNTEMINKIATSVAVIELTVTDLKKAVMGNGKPGLLDRVSVIENRHCTEDKDYKEDKEKKEKFSARTWAIVLIFITQFAGLVVLFIRTGAIK